MKLHKVARAKKLTISFLSTNSCWCSPHSFLLVMAVCSYKYPVIDEELSGGLVCLMRLLKLLLRLLKETSLMRQIKETSTWRLLLSELKNSFTISQTTFLLRVYVGYKRLDRLTGHQNSFTIHLAILPLNSLYPSVCLLFSVCPHLSFIFIHSLSKYISCTVCFIFFFSLCLSLSLSLSYSQLITQSFQ